MSDAPAASFLRLSTHTADERCVPQLHIIWLHTMLAVLETQCVRSMAASFATWIAADSLAKLLCWPSCISGQGLGCACWGSWGIGDFLAQTYELVSAECFCKRCGNEKLASWSCRVAAAEAAARADHDASQRLRAELHGAWNEISHVQQVGCAASPHAMVQACMATPALCVLSLFIQKLSGTHRSLQL